MCLFEFIMIALFQARARLPGLFRQPNRDVQPALTVQPAVDVQPALGVQPALDVQPALNVQPALDVQPVLHPVGLGEHLVLGDSNNEHMRHR